MKTRMDEVGIMAKCALGIAAAVALTLGMGGVVAVQLQQTFASAQLEPRSPSGKRGVVLVESATVEVLDQCLAQCDPVSSPALASQSTSLNVDSGS